MHHFHQQTFEAHERMRQRERQAQAERMFRQAPKPRKHRPRLGSRADSPGAASLSPRKLRVRAHAGSGRSACRFHRRAWGAKTQSAPRASGAGAREPTSG